METEFYRHGGLGVVRLNRPEVLNALGPAQFPAILAQLKAWMADDGVGAVLLQAAGERAFCAGGDIKAVWEAHRRGEGEFSRALFRREYTLDRFIHRLPKPIVSFIDGLVMGGGAGLSLNGRFQVATERTVFAMPEAAIGFFPDVGATHFLSRAPGRLGLYLGLTGVRLSGADLVWAGLASHHARSGDLPSLKAELARAAGAADPQAAIAAALDNAHVPPGDSRLARDQAAIEACMAAEDVATVIARVAESEGAWAKVARERLAGASPTSLAVIFRQLTEGRGLEFEAAIMREYRMACAFLAGHEFYEGIRAAVVDKDWRARWSPANLADVTEALVERHFAPLGRELSFDEEH
ncbi:MAG TPA: enoyl-CoA hydratase/isomerase family protein [Magnetospirillum sp.]|jgi:enoyl-CoA hydratase|nr:enoyl-CoA hydratase/isomerase family protein [Magnetospirillum sp.]